MFEFRFTRKLDTNEALTLERSQVAWGSRLIHDDAAVVGAICKPAGFVSLVASRRNQERWRVADGKSEATNRSTLLFSMKNPGGYQNLWSFSPETVGRNHTQFFHFAVMAEGL